MILGRFVSEMRFGNVQYSSWCSSWDEQVLSCLVHTQLCYLGIHLALAFLSAFSKPFERHWKTPWLSGPASNPMT